MSQRCYRCGEFYDIDSRLQIIRHEQAFCVTSPARFSDETRQKFSDGAKRGWELRRQQQSTAMAITPVKDLRRQHKGLWDKEAL